MAKLKDFDVRDILIALRQFSYTKVEDGETVNINVDIFPTFLTDMVTIGFESEFGSLMADPLYMSGYKSGALTNAHLAAMIKERNKQRWKYMLEVQFAEFNPLWNVDGVEKRITETDYGKKTTYHKGSESTTEQLEDAETISEQTVDAEATVEHSISPEDSQSYNPESKEHSTSNAGSSTVKSNAGKMKTSLTGEDYDKESDSDKVTDTFVRGGNIGVTKSTELLTDTVEWAKHFDFFHEWYHSIAEILCIPIYEED